jgi:hypothetical protein
MVLLCPFLLILTAGFACTCCMRWFLLPEQLYHTFACVVLRMQTALRHVQLARESQVQP